MGSERVSLKGRFEWILCGELRVVHLAKVLYPLNKDRCLAIYGFLEHAKL